MPTKKPDARGSRKPARRSKRKQAAWELLRIKRRIRAGYYDRPEIREDILDVLLEALMERG